MLKEKYGVSSLIKIK